MTREELDLTTKHVELTEALIAAKDAYRSKPSAKNKAARDAAVVAVREFTWYWRDIRTALTPGAGILTIKTKAN